MAGTASAGWMAPPTITGISVRLKCVKKHFSSVWTICMQGFGQQNHAMFTMKALESREKNMAPAHATAILCLAIWLQFAFYVTHLTTILFWAWSWSIDMNTFKRYRYQNKCLKRNHCDKYVHGFPCSQHIISKFVRAVHAVIEQRCQKKRNKCTLRSWQNKPSMACVKCEMNQNLAWKPQGPAYFLWNPTDSCSCHPAWYS